MKKKHIHSWTTALIVGIIIFMIYFTFNLSILSNRLQEHISPVTITTVEISHILEGYSEECAEYQTVEKYEFVEPLTCDEVCFSGRACVQNFYPEIDALNTSEEYEYAREQSMCATQSRCYDLCNEKFVPEKPHVKFWNESVCIKQILVKVTNNAI